MESLQVKINHFDFRYSIFDQLSTNHYAKNLWPLVYILTDGDTKVAYVGETTDAYSRMSSHFNHSIKSKLTAVHLITSDKFNKSATLDIESNLIKYMSGDNYYQLLNANLGLANHNYYQKNEIYWDIFLSVWNQLRAEGLTKHSINHIDNSDLFKYSPYKTLSAEQSRGLFQILESLATDEYSTTLVEGGAGTGKSILAIFLFKMLSSLLQDFSFKEFGAEEKQFIDLVELIRNRFPDPKMALVVPMSSFRNTLKKIFKNIKGLSANMVIGPAEVSKNKYDLLVVDESHRLRRRVNLGAYYRAFDNACEALGLNKYTSSELDWIKMQSNHKILFYDEGQSIKPSDAKKEEFDELKQSQNTNRIELKSQFRVKGGNDYVKFVDDLLNCRTNDSPQLYKSKDYEFMMFDSLQSMIDRIKQQDRVSGLSRLIAGYAWEWKSKNDKSVFDIIIGDVQLQWNGTSNDWINSENSIDEVGCIHTTQGYDLNYSGIIFGHEISFDPNSRQINIKDENYYDRNGKQSISDPKILKDFIINIYKTIMLRGIKGTYVYVCDPYLREYFKSFIPTFQEVEATTIELYHSENIRPYEDAIPVYDLKVAAGNFGENQKPEDVKWIKVPDGISPSEDLFACQIIGDSMNKVIPNGSYCLFRKYSGGSRNGKIVLVEHTNIQDDDFGSCYTIKEYESKKSETHDGWRHESIILKSISSDPKYSDIVLKEDDLSYFRVIGIFERVLGAS